MPADEPSADVIDVTIERDEHVTITFDDGLECVFGVADLRAACPCATCRGWRDRGTAAWPQPGQSNEISIVAAQFSGAWGLSITWSDGHSTGIYAFAPLRRWWLSGLKGDLNAES
ncbi:MAG: DUF971 domain-containing protein [Ilumatobacteraceae bacterium]